MQRDLNPDRLDDGARAEAEMKARDLQRQKQAFRHDPGSGIQGDCYRTAIACVLGVDRDSVPHSHDNMTGEENEAFTDAWLKTQGLTRIFMPVLADTFLEVANNIYPRGGGLPLIVTGQGPRNVNHVVVVHGVDDFWCPTLGAVSSEVGLIGPALPDNTYFWAEWIVKSAQPLPAPQGDDTLAERLWNYGLSHMKGMPSVIEEAAVALRAQASEIAGLRDKLTAATTAHDKACDDWVIELRAKMAAETRLASAMEVLERIRKQDRVTIYRGTEQQSYEDGPCGQIARTTLSSIFKGASDA